MPQSLSERARRLSPAAVLVVAAALAFRSLDDADTWWHLASGRWIATNWRVPSTDPFSHTVPDHAWINLQWLYDLVLYLLYRTGGAALLVLTATVAYTGAIALLLRTLRRWVGPFIAAALALAAVVVAEERFIIRPEMVSLPLLGLTLWVLLADPDPNGRRLYWLPPLMLLWVNTHSLFVIGLFCIACATTAALGLEAAAKLRGKRSSETERTKRLAVFALATVTVALVNPYVVRGFLFPLELLTRIDSSSSVYQSIGEFRPPWSGYFETLAISAYQSLAIFSVLVVAAALLVGIAARKRKAVGFRPGALALFVALLYVSTLARRNIALFALGAVPTVAMALAMLHGALAPRMRAGLEKLQDALAPLLCLGCLAFTVFVATNGYYRWNNSPHAFGAGVFEANFPVHAAEFAREAKAAPKLYNDLSAGGYLSWAEAVPGGIFVDGRLEVYDTEFYSLYRRGLEDPRSWYETARRYDIRTAIIFHRWQNRHPLIRQLLLRDSSWRLVYKDEVAVVFVRSDAAPALTQLTATYADATARRLAERRAWPWQFPVERMVALRSYADLNSVIGDITTALTYYDELLELGLTPLDEAEIRYRYGYHLAARGDSNRARLMLERARTLSPGDARIEKLLASLGGGR